jgi:thiamine biosynthesis lipoprotein
MGTVASVHVHDDVAPEIAEGAIAAAFASLAAEEARFSTFRPDSEISEVNSGLRPLLECSNETIDALDACTWLEHASGGAFSARRPLDGLLDPAGYVKGWAAERAAGQLRAAGLEHYSLGVGGDITVSGCPAPDQAWRIAVADPARDGATLALVELTGGAIATSGTAARGDHLWDGRDGSAPRELRAVTVVGPHLTWADAFATTVFALGITGLDWLNGFDGYRALAVTTDDRLLWTTGFPFSRLTASLLLAG